ncbi:NADP-dependent oxidoreductase [Sulfobacillus harzensis]|uniref:NADP-dependent oxidoreductase n=1 Tax=Sulfobacillus harzensis TaxID=2729629 RepID=A0A7Y0Q2F6_9FIRM|nr:NADP-dependent oxidoreductase [Sulfobacillus harzensis]NMP22457.1 NADP-dependent oxidoreductase [Sulfobacillus harzensis]
MAVNRVVYFVKRPEGMISESCFEIREEAFPTPEEEQVIVKSLYASVDPYMRGRMSLGKSYTDPFPLNTPMQGAMIGEVVDGGDTDLKAGDRVSGVWPWAEQARIARAKLKKLDPSVPPTAALHVLGMPGLTAYIGLTKFGQPKPGQHLAVSAAAGAVGSLVGQIGKILGLHPVGIAGSDEKCQSLLKLGFEGAVNYRHAEFPEELKKALPNGVDIYFDNVGGPVTDAVMALLNPHARIAICGQIATYNGDPASWPKRPLFADLLVSRARAEAFIVGEHQADFPAALTQLHNWYRQGRLRVEESISDGFDQLIPALVGLFHGANRGKAIVKTN